MEKAILGKSLVDLAAKLQIDEDGFMGYLESGKLPPGTVRKK